MLYVYMHVYTCVCVLYLHTHTHAHIHFTHYPMNNMNSRESPLTAKTRLLTGLVFFLIP